VKKPKAYPLAPPADPNECPCCGGSGEICVICLHGTPCPHSAVGWPAPIRPCEWCDGSGGRPAPEVRAAKLAAYQKLWDEQAKRFARYFESLN
jgi:hypothetical protein